MSPDASRRFTDREVAIVLRRAAEIEEADSSDAAGGERGLSLDDLRDIGRQVGISPAAIEKAVSHIERRVATAPLLAGAPRVRRSVHAVQGELNREALGRLIRVVDEKADSAGVVSEALGSVRWTSDERFSSTQVSLTPANGETTIRVTEKTLPRVKRIVHLVPAAWGAMLVPAVVSALDPSGAATVGILAAGIAAGAAAGRAVWTILSARSAARVERLAAELSREAEGAASEGLTVDRGAAVLDP